MPRNTPTCVGKTSKPFLVENQSKKHPHMRGEDFTRTPLQYIEYETPPHAWGRPDDGKRAADHLGNTPTCVGKTHGGNIARSFK